MPLAELFAQDGQGRRFIDVMADTRIAFPEILEFLDNPDRQRRMIESEEHHDRPALAGVICELESSTDVHNFFLGHDGHTTTRFRQAVGVAVRIVMENHGWCTTGRKGSLGVRTNVTPRTTTPGDYHNTGGLALWFTRAERYERPTGRRFQPVAERARQIQTPLPDDPIGPCALLTLQRRWLPSSDAIASKGMKPGRERFPLRTVSAPVGNYVWCPRNPGIRNPRLLSVHDRSKPPLPDDPVGPCADAAASLPALV